MYFIHHFTRVQRETSNHNFEKFMRCNIVIYIRSCWVKINSSFKPWLKSFLRDHQGFICMCQIDLRFNIFELSARIQYYEYFLLALGYASHLMQARTTLRSPIEVRFLASKSILVGEFWEFCHATKCLL